MQDDGVIGSVATEQASESKSNRSDANRTGRRPFRADHVGSLLRPAALLAARQEWQAGRLTQDELRAVEDDAIRDAVARQQSIGLHSITDGEFRRAFFHVDFLSSFEGIVGTAGLTTHAFKGANNGDAGPASMLSVNQSVRRTHPVAVRDFTFLASTTSEKAKLCIPSPTILHMRGGRDSVSTDAYPDLHEFWADIIKAYRDEISDLYSAGCRYLQLDDVSFAYLCDSTNRQRLAAQGEDPDAVLELYIDIVNRIVTERPPDLAVTMHTCRGNYRSMWAASGGYEPVAERMLQQLDLDGFFLEFDTERAGGFEPLRFAPKSMPIVLGLVSSKVSEIETRDVLLRRFEAAAKYVAHEDLCLSPQCGFASTSAGNRLNEDAQYRKLSFIVELAAEIWPGEV